MRRSEPQTVGEVLKTILGQNRLNFTLMRRQALQHWMEVVPDEWTRLATPVKVERDVLYINTDSAPLRSEIMTVRYDYLRLINQRLGFPLLKDLRFI